VQLNDDVKGFFENYCRAFEAYDVHALAAFFSYPVLFTRADSARPQMMIASVSSMSPQSRRCSSHIAT
jgi:hypothetical protein